MSTVLAVGRTGWVAAGVSVGDAVGVAIEPPQALTNNEIAASKRGDDFLFISTS